MNMYAPALSLPDERVLPTEAPCQMPVRGLADDRKRRSPRPCPGVAARRITAVALTLLTVLGLGWLMVRGLARDGLDLPDLALLALYLPNIGWTGFAAATAVCGLAWSRRRHDHRPPPGWMPAGRTAVLVPTRNERVADLEARIEALRGDLVRRGLSRHLDIFVLSDSDDPRIIRSERGMARAFACVSGNPPPVYYRRRPDNTGRKPGNIAEWLKRWGGAYDYMLLLDADSRMSADRIATMLAKMESRPDLGLLQAGVRLAGARSRLGGLLQRATRLYGPAFNTGIAGWAGTEGNYWGHNALARVAAFADAAGLPRLPGRAPFGGDILSHDFVEAAWLRRAGWAVEIDPDTSGSAEGGPETLAEFHKRDRRWCQGNLQHTRILAARGLHPVSRLHLLCGIGSYLAAPLWLGLVVAATLLGASGDLVLPLVGALGLILTQKLAGLAIWIRRRPRLARRFVRMSASEIALSTLLAPIVMVRQTLAVFSVAAGNDCGWKPAGGGSRNRDDMPWLEPSVGACLLLAVLPGAVDVWSVALVLPIVAPLLAAPLIGACLDLPPGQLPEWIRRALPGPSVPARQRVHAGRRGARFGSGAPAVKPDL